MICAFLVKSLKMKIVKKLFQPNLFSGLSAPTNQLFRRSCLDKIKWHDFFSLMWLTDLLTNRHWKFLSDAQLLENLGKIPCKFKLNPSSCLGGVVVTRFFDFDDLLTYLQTDVKNFCQMHNWHLKENSLEDFSLIHPAV